MEALRAARLAVVAVHEERGRLTCRLTVTYHDGRAPEGLEALLPDRGGALDLLDIAPRGAVLLAGCAVDYQAVWECITGLVRGTDPAAAATLVDGAKVAADLVAGVDTPEQLLAELGSQNALFILPVEGAGALPAGCMALRLGDTSHIPAAAETMAAMVVIGARAEGEPGLSLGHSVHDGVRLTTVRVDRPGPAGQLSPTVGLVGRDLVLTSTLDAAHELVDSARAGETVDLPTAPGTPFVAAALDCPAALRLLEQHKEAFVREVAESEGKPEEVVRRELQAVTRLLSLLSRIAVTGSYSEGRTDLVLAVEPAQMSG